MNARRILALALAACASAHAAPPPLELTWLGWDADELGRTRDAVAADGALDHHFRLVLKLDPGTRVVAFALREEREGDDVLRWSTHDARAELLVAEHEARRLGPNDSVPGDAVVDLYAHDIGQWAQHRGVVAQAMLADGSTVERRYTLSNPADTLVGGWQMHCQSSSPEAFEPMTLSGRMQFRAAPDGSVSGHFGSAPLTGKRDASGAVAGSVDVPGTKLKFEGKLEPTAPGRPLRGGGSFVAESAKEGCAGDGVWGSR